MIFLFVIIILFEIEREIKSSTIMIFVRSQFIAITNQGSIVISALNDKSQKIMDQFYRRNYDVITINRCHYYR